MATVYKILGQTVDSGSGATLYTVPSSTQTVISTLSICNPTSANVTANVYVVPNGGTTSSTGATLVGGATIYQHDTLLLTLGISLGTAGDSVQINSTDANVAFQLFGSEVS
jgi:hypothetical protein